MTSMLFDEPTAGVLRYAGTDLWGRPLGGPALASDDVPLEEVEPRPGARTTAPGGLEATPLMNLPGDGILSFRTAGSREVTSS